MRIAIGSDHAGFPLKRKMIPWLKKKRLAVQDVGCFSKESTDYPDYAVRVARRVARGRFNRGILFCGSGIGMSIAANKVRGVRAAVCWSPRAARLASEHNGANVLCVPSRFLSSARARVIIETWLRTPFAGGRHFRRICKIGRLERR